jgi:ABC-type phosphate/phosphonate transport system substrate-binding protein
MRGEINVFWTGLRAAFLAAGLTGVPSTLDRTRPYGVDPDGACFFTQTCSYTLFAGARKQFAVLGAPAYAAAGCSGSYHRSWIVVRDVSYVRTLEDLRGKRFAINELDSNSGMNLPRHRFAPYASHGMFFGETLISGSHAASADLVSRDAADAAAIDCVTFALLERYRPGAVRRLRILAETAATPTPPFVTSIATKLADVRVMRAAIEAFVADPAYAHTRDALLLAGFGTGDESDYAIVTDLERDAQRRGYRTLR